MCFGTDHNTFTCIATKIGLIKVTKTGSIRDELYNKSVHSGRTFFNNQKAPKETQEKKLETQISWNPFDSKIFEDLRPIHHLSQLINKI